MRRYADGTPCPAPHLSLPSTRYSEHGARRSSIYAPSTYSTDDTTANLEYTTEVQAHLRNVKPRRPMRGMRKSTFNPSLDIFEDVAQEEEQQAQEQQQQAPVHVKKESSLRASIVPNREVHRRSTILAHKAQRIQLPSLEVKEPVLHRPHRRRVSQLLVDRETAEVNATLQLQEHVLEKKELKKQGPKKDPRRRTIYVPSDDTTIMTIHPGQSMNNHRNPREKSPDIGLDLVTLSEEEPENLVSALKKERKAPRKSLAVPPKRAPLGQTSRQSVAFSTDIYGQGGGKENVPPGMEVFEDKLGTHIEFNFAKEDMKQPASKVAKVHFSAKTLETTSMGRTKPEGSQKRLRSQLSYDGSPAKSMKAKADSLASTIRTMSTAKSTSTKTSVRTAKSRISKVDRAPMSSSPFHTDRSPPTALRRHRTERAPTKITLMHEVGKPQAPKEQYPVLSEDLARPELYEDNWLTYQEVAITQLLNSLFDTASKDPNVEQSHDELRKRLLELYHEPSMPLLHRKLQASLQYGALSIPKDLLTQTLRLKDDVGLRKKFLNLWVKTYDLVSLRAAAETVIGRQITVPSRLSTGSTSSDDGSRLMRAERRAIENFLDTFLIRNEDAVRVKSGGGSIASIARGDHHGDDFGSQGWSWRRTVLRSLMLVLVLDRAKSSDIVSGCLFQSTSSYKTSTDVLHALSNMLLPSLGDITRPLGHLSYKVDHVQYPLQEYTYHIDNIAIDLRDGVVLTRLVELLLYPPATLVAQQEDTVTITMPTGDVLTSTFDFSSKESWVLSQHLKFPSIGRAQKLYNVQVALSALSGVSGIPVQGITADVIVDGHREKTLSLLWALVGRYGLGSLVDWAQIARETQRFRNEWYRTRDAYADHALDSDADEEPTVEAEGFAYHKRLLLAWSRSIARRHALRVSNLTTSFADPRILESIVDTYLPATLLPPSSAAGLGLAAKLKATGCSAAFVALFAPSTRHNSIPSADFSLLALAFLAARLLPLSRAHRAAQTIQRAFRLHRNRKLMSRRVAAMRIAHECAAVARVRERLVAAALLVQRRWRAVLEARRKRLIEGVRAFQSVARGWVVRRWARRVTAGRVGGRERVRRVRGGW